MPMQDGPAVSVDERGDIDVAAQMFRGFGDPTRLALLGALKQAIDPHGFMNAGAII